MKDRAHRAGIVLASRFSCRSYLEAAHRQGTGADDIEVAASKTRVKLRRTNSDYSKPYPPDGDNKVWWDRLKAALGTTSSDFVNATLVQVQNASRLPCGGICKMSVNAVLAFVEAAEPKE